MSDSNILGRLDALESRFAIERLIWQYAQSFDSRNVDTLRTIWHDDAVLSMQAMGTFEGIDAIVQAAHGFWKQIAHMHHWMANPIIDIDGDTATAVTALDCLVTDADTGPTQVGGVYRDRFDRRSGRWAIAERRFELHYWTPLPNWAPIAGSEAEASAKAA
jgi:ketosteroid isomerase-like protein